MRIESLIRKTKTGHCSPVTPPSSSASADEIMNRKATDDAVALRAGREIKFKAFMGLLR